MNLYFTLLEQDGPRQYFYVGMSSSRDLNHWTEPVILTEYKKRVTGAFFAY